MFSFLKKPLGITISLAVIIVVTTIILSGDASLEPEFVLATRENLVGEVSATGRVKPAESVDLALEKSGRVAWVNDAIGSRVGRGQILVQLENADLRAELLEAEANLKSKIAKLDELRLGTRLEEIQVQEAKVLDARQGLVDALRDAYTKSDDAIRNKIDSFIDNPRGSDPQINLIVSDVDLKSAVEDGRITIESLLITWQVSLNNLSINGDLGGYAAVARNNLTRLSNFLNQASLLINSVIPSGSASQATIDTYRANVSTARTNVNTATNNFSAAEAELAIAEKELALKQAGATTEQIVSQEALVDVARAQVNNIKAQIEKTLIRSPINGVIVSQDAKVGEIVPANTVVVSVISTDNLEIEVYIPEADVAKIAPGNTAQITLDAYGNDLIFGAAIIEIDPVETIIEGVATYKTTLQLTQQDSRIKPGLTANIDIIIGIRDNVIVVPQRAVIVSNGDKIVRVFNDNQPIEERPVVTGLRGSNGKIEIVSGLQEGERVIVFLEGE